MLHNCTLMFLLFQLHHFQETEATAPKIDRNNITVVIIMKIKNNVANSLNIYLRENLSTFLDLLASVFYLHQRLQLAKYSNSKHF